MTSSPQKSPGPSTRAASILATAAHVLAAAVAAFVLAARPLFPALASPLHRNILMHLAVAMAALLAALAVALRRRLEPRAPAFAIALVAFLGATILAAAFAGNRFAADVRGLEIAAWCVLALVLVETVSTPFRARILVAALVATLAVAVADGFYQFYFTLPGIRAGLDAHLQRMIDSGQLAPGMAGSFAKRAATGDVFGEFVTANGFAGYLILLLPLAAAATWAQWRERTTRLGLGAAALAVVALGGILLLALTRSKGGWLALAVALGGWGAAAILGRMRRPAAAAAIVLLAAALLVAPSSPAPDNATEPATAAPRSFFLGDSAEVRIEYWKAGWQMFGAHPWLGVGPGNFADEYLAYRTPEGSETRHAHNDYLEVAVEQGAIGLAAFLAVWATWWIGLARGRRAFPSEAAEDAHSRRTFAFVMAAVGPAAVAFVMSAFAPSDESHAMLVAGMAIWLGVYAVQAHALLHAKPERIAADSRLLLGAIGAGVAALLVHMAIDFDFCEPGVMATLAGMLAAGLALRRVRGEGHPRELGAWGQAAIVACVAAPLALVLIFKLYPLIDMSVAMEQAHDARDRSAKLAREADQLRAGGDLRGAKAAYEEVGRLLRVEYPDRLREAVRACPNNPAAWMELAQMEAALAGDSLGASLGAAEADLDRVKDLSPRDPAPWALAAQIYDDRRKAADARGDAAAAAKLAADALDEIDGAIARYPAQPKLRLLRARLLERLGRGADAVAEYRLALDLAERTSEKELKFTPPELRDIRLAIRRIETAAPGR